MKRKDGKPKASSGPRRIDWSGHRFGQVTMLKCVSVKFGHVRWLMRCDCGKEFVGEVKRQRKSCGCLNTAAIVAASRRHGMAHTPTYRAWDAMKRRCHNPDHKSYPLYGGRGITVCERWHRFDEFFADMGKVPEGMSIERIDNDGNYEPSNCKWATVAEQSRNRRTNVRVSVLGQMLCLSDAARIVGVCPSTISRRLEKGWSEHDAVFAPSVRGNGNPYAKIYKQRAKESC